MAKYRVEFENKAIKSIQPTKEEIPSNDTFLEERTGSTIWAIIEAGSEQEATEKAKRLATELQTGLVKGDLSGAAGTAVRTGISGKPGDRDSDTGSAPDGGADADSLRAAAHGDPDASLDEEEDLDGNDYIDVDKAMKGKSEDK